MHFMFLIEKCIKYVLLTIKMPYKCYKSTNMLSIIVKLWNILCLDSKTKKKYFMCGKNKKEQMSANFEYSTEEKGCLIRNTLLFFHGF